VEKLNGAWEVLQSDVDALVDSSHLRNLSGGNGLKQIIEKKSGIIRMHMMGKRVNFAARSVITPDPNLNIDEIGIPEAFAKHLTYPVPVTTWNVEELRKMIKNGPTQHPGAVMVEYEDGTIKRINPQNTAQQESILKSLLTPDKVVGVPRGETSAPPSLQRRRSPVEPSADVAQTQYYGAHR
jgi:DNA-directed RNA polymerase I subunit RPA1